MTLNWNAAMRLALLALVVMVIAHMRPPSFWSVTQYFFTYDLGFQRRSLWGAFLDLLYPDGMDIGTVHRFAALTSIAAVLALTAFMARSVKEAPSGGIILILFVTSLGMGTFIGNTGYLDVFLVLLAIPALLIRKTTLLSTFLASACLAAATLFHENALPFFAVLVGFSTWVQNPDRPVAARFAIGCVPVAVTAVAAFLVMALGTHPADMIDELRQLAKARSLDVTLRIQAFEPLVDLSTTGGQLDVVWNSWFFKFRLYAFGGVGLALLGVMLWLFTKAASHRSALDRLFLCLSALAPVAILIMAFDVSRFMAIAILNSYLAAAVLAREDAIFRANLSRVFSPLVVVALLLAHGLLAFRDLNSGPTVPHEFPGSLLYHLGWGSEDIYIFQNGYTVLPPPDRPDGLPMD